MKVEKKVGSAQPDLDFLREVCLGWLGKGWRPGHVDGILDWVERRQIPGKDRANGSSPDPPKPPAVVPTYTGPPEWVTGVTPDG